MSALLFPRLSLSSQPIFLRFHVKFCVEGYTRECLRWPEEAVRSPTAGVKGGCELPDSGPLHPPAPHPTLKAGWLPRTLCVTNESEPVSTRIIFASKRGGGSEAPSCPGPAPSLETPRACQIQPQTPADPPWSPGHTLPLRPYGIHKQYLSLCSGLCPKAAMSKLQEGSGTFSTNFRAEGRQSFYDA